LSAKAVVAVAVWQSHDYKALSVLVHWVKPPALTVLDSWVTEGPTQVFFAPVVVLGVVDLVVVVVVVVVVVGFFLIAIVTVFFAPSSLLLLSSSANTPITPLFDSPVDSILSV
jgi:hypothetical protein